MTLDRTRLVVLLLVVAALAVPGAGFADRAPSNHIAEVQHAIDSLDLLRAEQLIASLDDDAAMRPAALYYRGLLAFHHGDYTSAERDMNSALAQTPAAARPSSWQQMQTLAASTRALVDSMQVQTGGDGRYRVYANADDRMLGAYALLVLESADRALTDMLGVHVPGPLRLEIYPSAASLAQVSPLTEEQIETSGTIALCKWNRLMITTPRALVRGYPWADTIAHELTHLFVSFKTTERAPVWLQEGVAKLLERRWRTQPNGAFRFEAQDAELRMDGSSETLLLKAAKDSKLLPFERLHPSIAMLPSQEDAALAFAQVSTFMQRFVTAHGAAGLRAAFDRVAAGEDARTAVAAVTGNTFANLEREWSAALRKRANEQTKPGVRSLGLRFRHGSSAPDELSDVEQEAARRFLRLGDMLWSRGHNRAAATEYGKAHAVDKNDPIVASRYGRSALLAGDAQAARDAMQALLTHHPEHEPALSVLASSLVALGDHAGAQRAAIEAVLINPFDPQPHCALAKTLTTADREREQQLCNTLK